MNALPPPGWYPDAHTPGLERWWDGGEWSAVTRPAAGQPGGGAAAAAAPGTRAPRPSFGAPDQPLPYTPDGARLASWGRRAAARVLDGFVVWTIAAVVGRNQIDAIQRLVEDAAPSGGSTTGAPGLFEIMQSPTYGTAAVQLTVILLLASAVYEIPFLAMRGATPAKQLLGLRVRRWETDAPPSWSAAAGRWFVGLGLPYVASLVGTVFWLVDNLFPLWDGRRQAVHDKVARTVVVRIR